MLTKEELELLNNYNYNLSERVDINKYLQIRVYTSNTNNKDIIGIYTNKNNNIVLLYEDTYTKLVSILDIYIDSKKKINNKRKKI